LGSHLNGMCGLTGGNVFCYGVVGRLARNVVGNWDCLQRGWMLLRRPRGFVEGMAGSGAFKRGVSELAREEGQLVTEFGARLLHLPRLMWCAAGCT
jgi:hypothetical protein